MKTIRLQRRETWIEVVAARVSGIVKISANETVVYFGNHSYVVDEPAERVLALLKDAAGGWS